MASVNNNVEKDIESNILNNNEEIQINLPIISDDRNINLYNSRGLEEKKDLYNYRSFDQIKDLMNEKFGYKEGQVSIALDIIAIYLKGQKTLYLEAKSHSEFYLNRLMMPCILLSSVCSVISGVFNEIPLAGKIIAGATALNAFLMSLISYFKLDARAEAHKMTAYSFDQLISECEFTSGKILLSNSNKDKKKENQTINEKDNLKNIEIYDLEYVQKFLNNIEKKVREIKEKNQFIIPDIIRSRYFNTYNINIFTDVKNFQIEELILLNQLKIASNSCTDYENKIIKGDRSPEVYKLYNEKYMEKNNFIEKVIEHRKTVLRINNELIEELKKNQNNKCCKFFY